jgi:hypothetical protein
MNTSTIVHSNGVAPAPRAASRMSLNNTRDGILDSPMRILIYGGEKVGKSTFAAGAPGPVWLGADAGTDHLNIRRLPQPETFKEVLEGAHEVATNGKTSGVKTLVLDPLNWFEALVIADVVGDSGKSLAEWGGGYGRGPSAALDRWRQLKNALEAVWSSGLNVILCAHSHVKKFEDPEGPGYERYELAMNKEAAGLFKQWVDAILFARPDSFGKIDPTTKKVKAYGSSARMLYTELNPAYDAGNRWRLPPELPLSWASFIEAKTHGQQQITVLLGQIESGLRELGDPEVEKKVRTYLADPKVDVAEVANAVAAKLVERREQSVGKEG